MNEKIGLAILGGAASFAEPIHVGQLYFPDWSRYEKAMRGIFERQYYNNNGPLLTELEQKLASFFNVKHAICVHNGTFGLMMSLEALQLTGKVIVPSFTFIATVQAIRWAGLTPVFCDVDPTTHQLDITQLEGLIDPEVSAVLAVNLWGGACKPKELEAVCDKYNLNLLFDSAHGAGCEVDGKRLGSFGRLEVFSFHATKMISSAEGGCITTNDDDLAARLVAMRPSYAAAQSVEVVRVLNARMSEAQAAIGLLNLQDFEKNRQHNENIFAVYHQELANIPGVELVAPTNVTRSNYQYVVVNIDEQAFGLSRDQLQEVLVAENIKARKYFYPGIHRTIEFHPIWLTQGNPLPVTEKLSETCMQLPVGAFVDIEKARRISAIIKMAQQQAVEVVKRIEK